MYLSINFLGPGYLYREFVCLCFIVFSFSLPLYLSVYLFLSFLSICLSLSLLSFYLSTLKFHFFLEKFIPFLRADDTCVVLSKRKKKKRKSVLPRVCAQKTGIQKIKKKAGSPLVSPNKALLLFPKAPSFFRIFHINAPTPSIVRAKQLPVVIAF